MSPQLSSIAHDKCPTDDAVSDVLQVAPTVSAASAHLSFTAASEHFHALTRFGAQRGAESIPPKERVRAELDRRKKYESIFVKEGVIEIDSSGNIREHLKYARAVEEIRAKAAALGYGALSQSVPITDVQGGYVGRFGGHDIYVSV